MYVYQEEEGQVELILWAVLDQNDLDQILGHNPLGIKVDPLLFSISFCEPSKPVSFDTDKKVYFISLCYKEVSFLKNGNILVAIHMIEEVRFMLHISFEDDLQSLRNKSTRGYGSYMVLNGSTVE